MEGMKNEKFPSKKIHFIQSPITQEITLNEIKIFSVSVPLKNFPLFEVAFSSSSSRSPNWEVYFTIYLSGI